MTITKGQNNKPGWGGKRQSLITVDRRDKEAKKKGLVHFNRAKLIDVIFYTEKKNRESTLRPGLKKENHQKKRRRGQKKGPAYRRTVRVLGKKNEAEAQASQKSAIAEWEKMVQKTEMSERSPEKTKKGGGENKNHGPEAEGDTPA